MHRTELHITRVTNKLQCHVICIYKLVYANDVDVSTVVCIFSKCRFLFLAGFVFVSLMYSKVKVKLLLKKKTQLHCCSLTFMFSALLCLSYLKPTLSSSPASPFCNVFSLSMLREICPLWGKTLARENWEPTARICRFNERAAFTCNRQWVLIDTWDNAVSPELILFRAKWLVKVLYILKVWLITRCNNSKDRV